MKVADVRFWLSSKCEWVKKNCKVLFGRLAKKNLVTHKKYQEPESYNPLSCNQLS